MILFAILKCAQMFITEIKKEGTEGQKERRIKGDIKEICDD